MQVYAFQHLLLHLLPSRDSQKVPGQDSMHSVKTTKLTVSLVKTHNL